MDTFYKQFADFLDQLTQVFPDDSDFPTYKTGLLLFQKTNPMLVITEVVQHVTPFEKILREKNEDFILKHEFAEYDTVAQIIEKLKGMWTTLTPNNKQVVWTYLILLLDLAKKCVSLSQ